nr:hypothetical protein [Tanacetum cinerariifolium]
MPRNHGVFHGPLMKKLHCADLGDEAKRKEKGGTLTASSAANFNVEALARLMVNEYAMVNDPYNVHKGQNLTELLEIKKKELELKDGKLKIREMDQRQKDEAGYLQTTDEG